MCSPSNPAGMAARRESSSSGTVPGAVPAAGPDAAECDASSADHGRDEMTYLRVNEGAMKDSCCQLAPTQFNVSVTTCGSGDRELDRGESLCTEK